MDFSLSRGQHFVGEVLAIDLYVDPGIFMGFDQDLEMIPLWFGDFDDCIFIGGLGVRWQLTN